MEARWTGRTYVVIVSAAMAFVMSIGLAFACVPQRGEITIGGDGQGTSFVIGDGHKTNSHGLCQAATSAHESGNGLDVTVTVAEASSNCVATQDRVDPNKLPQGYNELWVNNVDAYEFDDGEWHIVGTPGCFFGGGRHGVQFDDIYVDSDGDGFASFTLSDMTHQNPSEKASILCVGSEEGDPPNDERQGMVGIFAPLRVTSL